uniref:Taxi A n=1 Tax=Mesovelia furcata TaxID=280089 RepID=A0A4V2HA23_9HEMI|nr:taxi A [Mesovelia furcata]
MSTVVAADPNNNDPAKEKSYSLRPRSGVTFRRGSDDEEEETVRLSRSPRKSSGPRTKRKSAPLSKYKRKNANARERSRMREINEAFDSLRRAVPTQDEKMTKIATLKLAMSYIAALTEALSESDAESMVSESTTSSSTPPPIPTFSLLDSSGLGSDAYSDFGADSLSLDPYDDFSFDLDDTFTTDLVS